MPHIATFINPKLNGVQINLENNMGTPEISIPKIGKTISFDNLLTLESRGEIEWVNPKYKEKIASYFMPGVITPSVPQPFPNNSSQTQFSGAGAPQNHNMGMTSAEDDYPDYGQQIIENPFMNQPNMPFSAVVPKGEISMPLGQYYNEIAENLDGNPVPEPAVVKKPMSPMIIIWASIAAIIFLVGVFLLLKFI